MYWNDYIWFITAMLFCTLFSAIASGKVHSAFSKYSKVRCRSGKTGYDTVAQLLWSNRVNGISVGRVKGNLSDHYDPRRGVVNLSESTYGNSSVASVAVAAHEMGHVMQKQEGYWVLQIPHSTGFCSEFRIKAGIAIGVDRAFA